MMKLAAVLLAVAACGGTVPATRYYQLSLPGAPLAKPDAEKTADTADIVLAVEPLATESAYDDPRIVYRSDPYRLDYYEYHRWSAAPGQMVGAFLEEALAKSGSFRAVVREPSRDTAAVLGGRVVAIEEIDTSTKQWVGRLALSLTLTDPRTGEVVWSATIEDREPLPAQTPEGLARAISVAATKIAAKLAPEIASHATATAAQREEVPKSLPSRSRALLTLPTSQPSRE